MTSWIFFFLMYFCPSSYVLTKKDISLKFWEMIENILVYVGLIHWSLDFYIKSYFYTFFIGF